MAARCPICNRAEATAEYRPFCSRRCANVDLQRWFSGGYAVPGEPVREGRGERDDDEG